MPRPPTLPRLTCWGAGPRATIRSSRQAHAGDGALDRCARRRDRDPPIRAAVGHASANNGRRRDWGVATGALSRGSGALSGESGAARRLAVGQNREGVTLTTVVDLNRMSGCSFAASAAVLAGLTGPTSSKRCIGAAEPAIATSWAVQQYAQRGPRTGHRGRLALLDTALGPLRRGPGAKSRCGRGRALAPRPPQPSLRADFRPHAEGCVWVRRSPNGGRRPSARDRRPGTCATAEAPRSGRARFGLLRPRIGPTTDRCKDYRRMAILTEGHAARSFLRNSGLGFYCDGRRGPGVAEPVAPRAQRTCLDGDHLFFADIRSPPDRRETFRPRFAGRGSILVESVPLAQGLYRFKGPATVHDPRHGPPSKACLQHTCVKAGSSLVERVAGTIVVIEGARGPGPSSPPPYDDGRACPRPEMVPHVFRSATPRLLTARSSPSQPLTAVCRYPRPAVDRVGCRAPPLSVSFPGPPLIVSFASVAIDRCRRPLLRRGRRRWRPR